MLKIGICDDDIQELFHISSFLEKYKKEKELTLTHKVFKNGAELLDTINYDTYDILFLDILMPGLTGMEVAKEIRSLDNKVKIIFLTSSPEYALESYTVNAYHYLLKPTTEEKLFAIMDKLILDSHKPDESLIIKTQSGIIRIPYSNIEYVEVFSKTVSFHLINKEIRNVYGSLKNFENNLLNINKFVKIHRSYIVNMQWIQEFGTKEIVTEFKHKIPISRPLYTSVKDTYMKYLFIEKDVK